MQVSFIELRLPSREATNPLAMSSEGALEPPPGVTPNFVDPFSLVKYDVFGQSMCLAVSTLMVGMRMYSKSHLIKSVGWEDCKSTAQLVYWIFNNESVKIVAVLPGYVFAPSARSIVNTA